MYIPYKIDFDTKMVYHELLNSYYGKYIPHECFFIEFLYKNELQKNPELAEMFLLYIMQFAPHHKWTYFNLQNALTSVMIECDLQIYNFHKIIAGIESSEKTHPAIVFGDIVTEFLIRFCGYNLIGCCNQKVIITSANNCQKKFIELLEQGYELHRLAELTFIPTPKVCQFLYPGIKGFFKKLPVLPTKDTYIPFNEAIEGTDEKLHDVIETRQRIRKEKEEE